jgi:hypothetical protein
MVHTSNPSRSRQEDVEFEASLGYMVIPCLEEKKKKRDFSVLFLIIACESIIMSK